MPSETPSGGTSSTYNAISDGNGNVIALIDADSGEQVIAYEYDPFGNLLNFDPLDPDFGISNIRFSTRYFDVLDDATGEGLYQMGARFYDPAHGRWLNRDPLGPEGGVNLYAYSSNDPIGRVDPLGLVDTGYDSARSSWDNLKDKASQWWNSAKEKAGQFWNSTKEKASQLWNSAKDKAGRLWNSAKDKAGSLWNSAKDTLLPIVALPIALTMHSMRQTVDGVKRLWNNAKYVVKDSPLRHLIPRDLTEPVTRTYSFTTNGALGPGYEGEGGIYVSYDLPNLKFEFGGFKTHSILVGWDAGFSAAKGKYYTYDISGDSVSLNASYAAFGGTITSQGAVLHDGINVYGGQISVGVGAPYGLSAAINQKTTTHKVWGVDF